MSKKRETPVTDKRHVGAKAHRNAIKKLIEAYADEFALALGDAREAEGLPREPAQSRKPSKTELLRQQLRDAGIEPTI